MPSGSVKGWRNATRSDPSRRASTSSALGFWGGSLVPIPWINPDEIIYGELGRSLYHSGTFRILGRPTEFISLVYPALVGGPLSLGNVERGYHLLKLVQALLMSLTAIPVYLWPRSLGARGLAFVAAALLAGAWAGWRLRHGGALSRVFGAYEPAGQIHYGAGRAARFVVYHYADLALFTGLLPLCAVLALLVVRDRADERLRAYLATTIALCLWFPLEVGIFASQHVGYLAERNMLPLAPVLFVGFAAWLARGGPRPRLVTAATIVGILVLVVVLPVQKLVRPEAFPDSFTLLPLIRLEKHSPGPNP